MRQNIAKMGCKYKVPNQAQLDAAHLSVLTQSLRFFMTIVDYTVYILFRIFVTAVNLLPLSCVRAVSGVAGTLAWWCDPRERRTIMTNLERAFGDAKSVAELKCIGRKVLCNFILNLCQFLRIRKYSFDRIKGMVDPVNMHYVDEAMKRGKGLIFVTAHFGNWELLGIMGKAALDKYSVVSIGRTLKNRFIDRYINDLREYTRNKIIPKKDAVFQVMRTLKANGIVTLFADQVGGNDGVLVDFFGSRVLTVSSPAFFSIRTGAPVIPAFFLRDGDRFKLVFEKPIEPQAGASADREAVRITSLFTKTIERYIREYPEEWFWLHKRWKSKRAKKAFANSYKIIVHAPNWIGDAVLSLPAVKGIRDLFPNARLAVMAKRSVAPVFLNNPAIDAVVPIGSDSRGGRFAQTVRSLRQARYDLGILFPNSFKSALLFYAGGVRHRIGYAKDMRGMLLTRAVKRDKDVLTMHHRDYYYRLAREAGNVAHPAAPKIFLDSDTIAWADDCLRSNRKGHNLLIGINPGGAYGPAKRWPPQRFGELAAMVTDGMNGEVIIFGSAADRDVAREIQAVSKKDCIDMTGRTDLRQLAALLERCDVLVTNDSGPMHIASAVGTPVVAIFGSTDPAVTSPAGEHVIVSKRLPCAPCLRRTCDKAYACMDAIAPRDVYAGIEKALTCLKKI